MAAISTDRPPLSTCPQTLPTRRSTPKTRSHRTIAPKSHHPTASLLPEQFFHGWWRAAPLSGLEVPLPSLQGKGTPPDFIAPLVDAKDHQKRPGEGEFGVNFVCLPCRWFENGFVCCGRCVFVFFGCLHHQTACSNSSQPIVQLLLLLQVQVQGLHCCVIVLFVVLVFTCR